MNTDLEGHVPIPSIFLLFGDVLLTFQTPALQNANTCRKTCQNIYFVYLDNKEMYCHFKTCYIIYLLLPTKSCSFIIEKKRLQWYGQVKRMPEERIPKLIMGWIPWERRKRGRPRKTWTEGVQAAITTRNLEPDQWRNREEWRLVSGRRRQLLKKNRTDR